MKNIIKNVYIYHAKRTAIGAFLKSLKEIPSVDLSCEIIKNMCEVFNFDKYTKIDQFIIGQVLTCGLGQNPARQIILNSNLSNKIVGTTINQVCGSGLKSVALGAHMIENNFANHIITGGQENMSRANHYIYARNDIKYGNGKCKDNEIRDSILEDGLTDSLNHISMMDTAQYLATKYNISREEQDIFALNSHKKASYATNNGFFEKEIQPIKLPQNNEIMNKDENIRYDTSLEKLSNLKTIVKSAKPTITAGNSSSINDGSAIISMASKKFLNEHKIEPLAKIITYAEIGLDPMEMGLGPIYAIKEVLKNSNWIIDEVDLFEIDEAFASQVLICVNQLNLDINKLNISGGAIALGHPIGASGARILTTLIHNLIRLNKSKGIAALCIGGGMGIAMCVEIC